jgi:hypothetical protein
MFEISKDINFSIFNNREFKYTQLSQVGDFFLSLIARSSAVILATPSKDKTREAAKAGATEWSVSLTSHLESTSAQLRIASTSLT